MSNLNTGEIRNILEDDDGRRVDDDIERTFEDMIDVTSIDTKSEFHMDKLDKMTRRHKLMPSKLYFFSFFFAQALEYCKTTKNSNLAFSSCFQVIIMKPKGQNSICKIHVASLLDQVQSKTKVWKTETFDTNKKKRYDND